MRERKASMVVRFALPLAFLLCAWSASAQVPTETPGLPGPPDGVAALLNRLEQLLQQNDRDNFPALLSTADITGVEAEQATDDLFSYDTTRAIVRERDRTPLEGSLRG